MSEINRNMKIPGPGSWRSENPTVRPESGAMTPGQGNSNLMPEGNMGMPRPEGNMNMPRPEENMNLQRPEGSLQMPGMNVNSATNLCAILRQRPHATAVVRGSGAYPQITGRIMFYQMRMGVLVAAEVFGLPAGRGQCESPVFGFHIHGGTSCSGNMQDPFADALEHYNPGQCMHPQHAGDMPPLFGNNGYAFQVFLTDRFTVREVIGKTVIIHSMPDDFRSQPGGNAGQRIACGQILGREAR